MAMRPDSPVGFGQVGIGSRRQALRHIKTCYADSAVCHSIVDVESIGCAEIVASVNTGRKNHIGNGPISFLWQQRG
jgi:hypothetical protein